MHDRNILKIKVNKYKSNDSNDWSLFKKQRNIVNSEIRLAKQTYYQNSFNKYTGDSKKTWQTINELTSRKSGKKIGDISESKWSINNKSNCAVEAI